MLTAAKFPPTGKHIPTGKVLPIRITMAVATQNVQYLHPQLSIDRSPCLKIISVE